MKRDGHTVVTAAVYNLSLFSSATSATKRLSRHLLQVIEYSLAAWLIIEKGFHRAVLGRAVGLGIMSHLILDLLTHGHDIVLWPGLPSPRLGLGLYEAALFAAFIVELAYGIFCWRVYQGSRGLLALIVIGNLANLSFLSPAIPGPESYLAGRPLLVVTVVFRVSASTSWHLDPFSRTIWNRPASLSSLSRSPRHCRCVLR